MRAKRLVYSRGSGSPSQMTVTFAEQGGKTRVTARMLFASAMLRHKAAKEFGAVEGLSETLERLAEHLAKMGRDRQRTHQQL